MMSMLSPKRAIISGVLVLMSLITLNHLMEPDNVTFKEIWDKNRDSRIPRRSLNSRSSTLGDENQENGSFVDCQTSPCADEIKVYNKYWQKLEVSDGSILYLYNAYTDNRSQVTKSPLIRILAMRNRVAEQNSSYYCQIQFANGLKYTTKDVRIELIGGKDTYWQAILITCQIDLRYIHKIPQNISLVEDPLITASNNMEVFGGELEKETKMDIAICHKALEFPDYDNSIYLIEWFELMLLQGVDKIFMYEYSVHPNISKVLNYYIKKGKLQVTPLTMPPNMISDISEKKAFITTNSPVKDELEKIPYNDCFYKNINKFKFIAVIDQDEVIVPRVEYKVSDMIKALKRKAQTNHPKETFHAYSFNRYNSVYENQKSNEWSANIPKHMSLLIRSPYRSPRAMPPCDGDKSILDTELAVATGNHLPSICSSECNSKKVIPVVGHVRHFRSTCESVMNYYYKYCNKNSIKDDSMQKYKSQLIKNVARALDKCLGIREL